LARFLDSAVLVPVFVADHPHHEASVQLYKTCSREGDWCASQSLAEVYSTLTRLPHPHKATPEQAIVCIENIVSRFRLMSLESEEYISLLQEAAQRSIGGRTVYDALIARCALKAGADEICTWNIRHYQMLGPDVAKRLKTPVL
jgi:predicted nucleic acid-binding protein